MYVIFGHNDKKYFICKNVNINLVNVTVLLVHFNSQDKKMSLYC